VWDRSSRAPTDTQIAAFPMGRNNFNIPRERIAEFCLRHQVKRIDLFGSALREDFRPDSDVDLLIDFKSGADPSLMDLAEMEDELARIIGRKVDLVERQSVEGSANYIRRSRVLNSLEPIYVA